ncbi:MAG: hypothetical protein Q9216_001208 [Gyalolechia sp. 2 TL-2023]
MRLRSYNYALNYSLLLLLPSLAYSITLDCKDIRDNKQSFDVSALGNPISVMHSQDHSPSPTRTNTTFTVDICKPLKRGKGIPSEEDCPMGSQAGNYLLHQGVPLDPKVTRLKTSSSASDREKEGFRLELHGLKYDGKKQKAVIEFLCQDKAEDQGSEERDLSSITTKRKVVVEEEEEEEAAGDADDKHGEEEDHSAAGEVADDGHGGTLTYEGYDEVDDTKVLSLEWKTKYACENSTSNDSETKKSHHWGFFTWLIIMYVALFLALPLSPYYSPNS